MKNLFLIIILLYPFYFFSQEKEGWVLTFSDEFNSKQVDYTKWKDHYYWGGRHQSGSYVYYSPNQFEFTDTTVKLLLNKNVGASKDSIPFVSGMLDSSPSFKQKYGYFEIRCMLPETQGFWPAFWLVSDEAWPPEIDIFEIFTNFNSRILMTQHWKDKNGKRKMHPKTKKIPDAGKNFNTYAIEWNEKEIIWYVNGKKLKKTSKGMDYINQYAEHIIVNLSAGGFKEANLETLVTPSYMEIDYIRAYKKN